jgi:hypothetical protein
VRIEWGIFFHIIDMLNKPITTIMVLLIISQNEEGTLNSNMMLC